jgi:lipoprotein-anchoring transpeptidase ErfK/SrfK
MKNFIAVAALVTSGLALSFGVSRSPARMAAENTMPGEIHIDAQPSVPQQPLKLPLADPKVVVSKSKRQLQLYAGGEVVRTYRIALGANPVEDKVREGDGATPEGDFYVCVKNARSNFYLSLGLSYPNAEDAERGLRDKLITRAERAAIVRAIQNKRRPPWDTALGGEIFIHGGGTNGDWTRGCVALSNEDIRELFDALPLGTPVRIEA